MIKLADLNPGWVNHGGEYITNAETGEPIPFQQGVGITFDCPCGNEKCLQAYIPFSPAIDGSEYRPENQKIWDRVSGDNFDNLTLAPSIHNISGCGWHGHLRNGIFTSC